MFFPTQSMTIAELEQEARQAGSSSAITIPTSAATNITEVSKDGLIVLRKDDLNSILTSKPTFVIGREIVSLDFLAKKKKFSFIARFLQLG